MNRHTRHHERESSARVCCGLIMVVMLLSGCQTERITRGVSRPVPAVPHDPPPTPEGAQVNRMVFVVGSKPVDTNGNGFPDRIEATVTLFASPHPMPLWEEGRLVCSMYMKGKAHSDDLPPIAVWSYEGEELDQIRSISSIGPQYMLRLNLLTLGSDRLPFGEVDIVCRFEPIDGRNPVHCDGVRSIQIGRRGSR